MKQSGLGDNFYIGGNDLSGDVASLDQVSGGPAPLDVTGLNKSANERIGGLRDGDLQFTTYFDAASEQPALSVLPTLSVIASYLRGTGQGNTAACLIGRQINYDGTRDNTGNLTMKVEVQADHYGLEWGTQLTSGIYSAANLLTGQNAGFEGGLGTWVTGVGSPTLAESSAKAHAGSDSMSMTSAGTGTMAAKHVSSATGGFAVTPGQHCYVQAWLLAGSTGRTSEVAVNWYNSGGTLVSTSVGTGVADNTSTWTLANGTFAVPATGAFATVIVQVAGTVSTEVHYVDDVEFIVLPSGYDTGLGAYLTGDNSTMEGSTGNWNTAGNCTIARSASAFHTGAHSMAITAVATGDMEAASCQVASITTQGLPVTPGNSYYVGGWFLAAATPQNVRVGMQFYTAAGSSVGSTLFGSSVTDSTTAWVSAAAVVTAPATATYGRIVADVQTTSAIGEVHYLDDVNFWPAFGAQAYLQVTAFTGTDATVKVQDSADGLTWADVTGLAFTQVTAAPFAQRVAIANGTAVRRYVTVTAISTGGFTALSAAVVLVKNLTAVSF